jgi:hypothetical protein
MVLAREQLAAFLDKGEVHVGGLPTALYQRLALTRFQKSYPEIASLGLPAPSDDTVVLDVVVCGGALTDKKKKMYFWRLSAPEFLHLSDEQGRSCVIYLSPSPIVPNLESSVERSRHRTVDEQARHE